MEYKTTNKITEKVIKEILEVKEKKGLTAEEVINKAQNKKSSLHDLFEWDDSIAGEKYRLQQARVLINEVKIIVNTEEYYAFENVSLSVEEDNSDKPESVRQYFTRKEIIDSIDFRQQIIQRAYNNILYWKRQYECYSEFQPIIDGINKVQEMMDQEKAKNDALKSVNRSGEVHS